MTVRAHLGERDVVTVSGPEAAAYLQGQISQDVDALGVGEAVWSLVLQPTGKVESWCRVQRSAEDTFALDVDAGYGDALAARLRRFLLRTAADIAVRTGIRWVAVRGSAASAPASALPIAWPGVEGYDLLGDDARPPDGAVLVDDETFTALRIRAGVPSLGAELTEASIPAEAGQALMDASVSFTKGCYTGQELVARIDSRGGHVPRPLRGLVASGPVAPGSPVQVEGADVGAVTSCAPDPDGDGRWLALAPLARSVEPGVVVTIPSGGGAVEATVTALPMP